MDDKIEDQEMFTREDGLCGWILDHANEWREFYDSNYKEAHEEYYRLWRGIWSEKDKTRDSERSKMISPALQQAVESNAAEIEEATFGRGKWFDIADDFGDKERQDVMFLRSKLQEDFDKYKIRKAIGECILTSAVYGTAVAEVVLDEVKEQKIATQPVMDNTAMAYGVETMDRTVVKLRPVLPQNFLIDPTATCVEDAMGVIIEEFVSEHSVIQAQEAGIYRNVYVGQGAADSDLEPDQDLVVTEQGKVKLTKYYGLVPKELLENADEFEDLGSYKEDTLYCEAIVVIANDGEILKAEHNPYMMKDRPIVTFSWDVVPGRFWGRGVCEKGYNSQKALDAELRARIDALALTVHPMMAMDATRLPRGAKPEIRPGKIILTNGAPNESLMPFNFGQVQQIQFTQAQALQQMVQQATGAVDSAGIAGQINGEATAAGISMSLGAIIKRHKRTLVNFQESFLLPFVTKAAHRYMQFDPEHYPIKDYNFKATSTLGIMAREYEITQLTQLLQTLPPESPAHSILVKSIVDNMNLNNREEVLAAIEKASQPTPEQQQEMQKQKQLAEANAIADIEIKKAQAQAMQAQAGDFQASAQKKAEEAKYVSKEFELDMQKVAAENAQAGVQDDLEFQRRLKVMELGLKEREMANQMEIAKQQFMADRQRKDSEVKAGIALKAKMNDAKIKQVGAPPSGPTTPQ